MSSCGQIVRLQPLKKIGPNANPQQKSTQSPGLQWEVHSHGALRSIDDTVALANDETQIGRERVQVRTGERCGLRRRRRWHKPRVGDGVDAEQTGVVLLTERESGWQTPPPPHQKSQMVGGGGDADIHIECWDGHLPFR